ncbi:MAG: M12 family metallopeptidase [Phycisphaerales bacterium]
MRTNFSVVAVICLAGAAWAGPAPAGQDHVFGQGPGENVATEWAPCQVQDRDTRGTTIVDVWPGGVVPYQFNANVNSTNQSRARAAMDEIEAVSNVRFVPRTDEVAYVQLNASSSSNSSPVGYSGGSNGIQIVSWSWRFIICHELMHSLGIYHEQQRAGRSAYIEIHWDNIEPGYENNFRGAGGSAPFGPYDFESVMHYGPCSFSVCSCSSCPTITVQPAYASMQSVIGQRNYLSDGDRATLAFMYNGPSVGDDAFEPNDDPGSAAPITPGSYELIMGDEADCFSFTLDEASEVSVHAGTEEAAWSATVELLDASGGVLASDANGKYDDGEPVNATLPAGTYGVRVAQVFGYHPYVLSLVTTPTGGCPADLDGNGTLNLDDVNLFAAGFVAGDTGIDQNADGVLNLDDVNLFAQTFVAGCP